MKCEACGKDARLERAAVLRNAITPEIMRQFIYGHFSAYESDWMNVSKHFLALIPAVDQSALDAHDAEILREPRRLLAEVYGEFVSRHYIPSGPMPTDGSHDTRWMKEVEAWLLKGSK